MDTIADTLPGDEHVQPALRAVSLSIAGEKQQPGVHGQRPYGATRQTCRGSLQTGAARWTSNFRRGPQPSTRCRATASTRTSSRTWAGSWSRTGRPACGFWSSGAGATLRSVSTSRSAAALSGDTPNKSTHGHKSARHATCCRRAHRRGYRARRSPLLLRSCRMLLLPRRRLRLHGRYLQPSHNYEHLNPSCYNLYQIYCLLPVHDG